MALVTVFMPLRCILVLVRIIEDVENEVLCRIFLKRFIGIHNIEA